MKTYNFSKWHDVLGRSLTTIAALGALTAFVSGIKTVQMATVDALWVEMWRLAGFLLFAGMFALLTLRPRQSAGIWELAFLHKAAMAVISLFIPFASEATSAGTIDGFLAILLLVAYLLTRSWRSWHSQEVME